MIFPNCQQKFNYFKLDVSKFYKNSAGQSFFLCPNCNIGLRLKFTKAEVIDKTETEKIKNIQSAGFNVSFDTGNKVVPTWDAKHIVKKLFVIFLITIAILLFQSWKSGALFDYINLQD